MKKAAVFFDRDNTLIDSDGYVGDPDAVVLIPGAADAIARARSMGFVVATFSNQSGVARGLFTEETVRAVNQKMDELLQEENSQALVDRHEFCPFHPQGTVAQYRFESDLRKPKPGMILQAAAALDLDLATSWVVGDAPRDIEAGHAAGCRTILVKDLSISPSSAALERSSVDPDETVTSLAEALDVIEAAGGVEPPDRVSSEIAAELEGGQRKVRTATAEPPSNGHGHQHAYGPLAPMPDPSHLRVPRSDDLTRLEHLAQQILDHLRRRHEHPPDFSMAKMLAGVTQILAIALAVGSYFYKPAANPFLLILVAIFMQLLTIALLLMGRDR